MSRFIDIISPIYQDLLGTCERRKVTLNLDFQDLTYPIEDDAEVEQFYKTEAKRALKLCEKGDKITLSQSVSDTQIRFSVKNSSKTSLNKETAEKLREKGYEVRARFGYDTIVTLKVVR